MEESPLSSIYIAPLHIKKEKTLRRSNSFNRAQHSSATGFTTRYSQSKMQSASLSHHHSKECSRGQSLNQEGLFHNYIRACFSFHPTCDENSSAVTLPLNKGDIILVHSVHTNGWADGTLLTSGARGWLPTNYCEPYLEAPNHVLMKALTMFWDMMRGTSRSNPAIFGNQDYLRGLVAGIRCLLVNLRLKYDARLYLFLTYLTGENRVSHQRFADDPIPSRFTSKSQSPALRPKCTYQNLEALTGLG